MQFKRTQHHEEQSQPLAVPGQNGAPLKQYPDQVVAPLRQMVTRVTRQEQLPQRLALVAALRQEGVTFLAQALAATIAHDYDLSVCVVELNWWWPSHQPPPATSGDQGLAGVLAGRVLLEDVIVPSGWSNLATLPSGHLPAEKRPVVARSKELQEALVELSDRYDHIILDIPAVRATNDAVPLASLADACCFVVRQGVTVIEDVRLALDEIDHLRLLGVVMNRADMKTPNALVKLVQNV